PAAVLLREVFGFLHAAARRHGEDHLARGGIDAQRVTPRLAVTAQPHRIDRLVENDLDDRGLARPTVKERAHRHDPPCSNPGRILPYWQEGTARPATNKGLPQEPGFIALLRHNIWCSLRFEFVFITFRRRQASPGHAATHFSVMARAKFSSGSNR